jgi:hypothetical protein
MSGTYEELLAIFQKHKGDGNAMAEHLETLRMLASECDIAVEFGVQRGASTTALLLGAKKVISYDIKPTRQAQHLAEMWPHRLDYRIQSSLEADIPECDLIFFDSIHTYSQLSQELKHASKCRRWLVFHDTLTFGSIGGGLGGGQLWSYQTGVSCPLEFLGIRPAIDEFMIANPHWRMIKSTPRGHGLLVLERHQR